MFFEKIGGIYVGRFRELFGNRHLIHGFSTRHGGVSSAPYDSLNLGYATQDDPGRIQENRRRFFQAVGIDETDVAVPQQVHGDRIVVVTQPGPYPQTDGLITDTPGVILTVETADCVPLYLIDPIRPAIGLVHVGWRGMASEVGVRAVRMMAEAFGTRPDTIEAFLGPSIGPCCFEVSQEVVGLFPICATGRWVDLWRCQILQLKACGVREERIQRAGLCTRCHQTWFFSHRGGGRKTGRMVAFLGITR